MYVISGIQGKGFKVAFDLCGYTSSVTVKLHIKETSILRKPLY